MFLIAKEFSVDVEVVKRWPLRKYFKHRIFLKEYFEQMNSATTGQKRSTGSSTPTNKHKYQFR